ncbi:ECs1072 family phage-associated protein [Serratia sp. D1N4]
MSSIHNLWHVIKSRICENRGLSHYSFHSGSAEDNCIKTRSAQIFILEMVLHKHRQQYATIFEPLQDKKALHHLIFTKTKWKPSEISQLSLADCLFVIQDEMRIDKLSGEVKYFTEYLELPSTAFVFDELLEEDWAPRENSIFLAAIK